MYTLTIENYQLILDPDFKPPLLYKNPCWCFNEIPAPLCLDVTIPDNDVNRNRLGFPGRFAKMAKSNDRKFPAAELRWNGYLYIYGTLVITKPTADGYSGYIQSELRSLSDALREKLISDHNLLGELTFVNKPNYDPDTDLYCTIKLRNAGFWADKSVVAHLQQPDGTWADREVLTTNFDFKTGCMVNANDPAGVVTSSGIDEVIAVSPFPFLSKLIVLLLKENKFFMRNNFIATDETLKTLALYTNTSICKAITQTQEFPEEATTYEKYYDDNGLKQINPIVQVLSIQWQEWTTNTFFLKKLLPKIALNELLLSVQNLTNTFHHFSGIDDVDCVDRESLFDMTPFDLSKYRVSRWLPGTRKNKVLKFKMNHDSDDQEFSQNFSDISSREEDIRPAVPTYADLSIENIPDPVIGNIRLVEDEEMLYEYRQETVTDEKTGKDKSVLMWAPFSMDIQDYKYNPAGDGSEDIETKFSTLRMHENGYPVVYQKGNNSQFAQYTENFSARLLFYNGNNTGGSTASNGMSLNWKSIVPKRYRRTAAFYANALPVEADFRIPGNIFYRILNQIYIPFLDVEGSFFIDEMQVKDNNSEFVEATLSVFKNEDNVFEGTTGTVDGDGTHVGSVFTPKFVGVTETGRPILVNETGRQLPLPVFGDISTASYSKYTCIDYDPAGKLMFIGGNNGQLHVCDLSDKDNLRYKTIQVFAGTDEVSAVAFIDTGAEKKILVAKAKAAPEAFAQPYHANFDDYASNEAVQTASFASSSDFIRAFLFVDGYYYACNTGGEMFRTNNLATQWSQVFDTHSEYIRMAATQNRIWLVELNEDLMYSLRSDPTHFNRFGGLSGTPLQKVRDLQTLSADNVLYLTADDEKCIWFVNATTNQNITPGTIKTAGGACYDGNKYAYIAVKDKSGYTKIARYNPAPVIPEAQWVYINVQAFFQKLFLY